MPVPSIVIGLTGAFASGCSTAAGFLRSEREFQLAGLSGFVRAECAKLGLPETRKELQRVGDEIRQRENLGALVDHALEGVGSRPLVVDGVRNVGEVRRLRELFGYRFLMIAVLASQQDRWDRVGPSHYVAKGLGLSHFIEDDIRDTDEGTEYGQQVELCIDQADVLLRNMDLGNFKDKVISYADLLSGAKRRNASPREILMNMAYAASHNSRCPRRHVGAVVVDPSSQVVGVGYNENPRGTRPCVEEPRYNFDCYRNEVRNRHFEALSKRGAQCPTCGAILPVIVGPPWRCPTCAQGGVRTNLEAIYFPDRAMNWCTAIHAEVWALMAAGERARGGSIYSTTFPCLQCTEKIIHAGIKTVCYTEAYVDHVGQQRLEMARVKLIQFEGVRSRSFDQLLGANRPA
jgi:deoxycytidylate deaminase